MGALLDEADGVPFVLEALAARDPAASGPYRRLIEERLDALSAAERALVEIAALAGRAIALGTAARAAEHAPDPYAVVA